MNPKIHLYTVCWNEKDMLGHFFRHYDPIVDTYHVFDDNSDDNSREILRAHPRVVLYDLPITEDSFVLASQKLHNEFWKELKNDCDWVIISAVDELLYHKYMSGFLNFCSEKKITAMPAVGFQMISESYPSTDTDIKLQVTRGAPWSKMSKLCVFNPKEIEETNFVPGRHLAKPIGNVVYPPSDKLLNLHFKYLSFDKTLERHIELDQKMRAGDKERKFGHRYRWTRNKLQEDWDKFHAAAIDDVINLDKNDNQWKYLGLKRWWRE